MKFSPLSLIKKRSAFEFIQEQNVETEEIKDPSYLISWAEDENVRILDENSEGSVVVVKRDKKDRVLFAQQLQFPMSEDTDFDTLLDKFYTRKPIKFDQTLLEENTAPFNQSIPVPVVPEIATAPVPPVSAEPRPQEDTVQNYAAVPSMPGTDTPEASSGQSNANEIKELIDAQKAQEEEIQNLKQQLEEERKSAVSVVQEKVEAKEHEVKRSSNVVAAGVTGVGSTKRLPSFEPLEIDPDLSFQDRMNQFIEQEKQKIETEIFAADQRDLIEAEVMAKIKEEKEESLSRTEVDLYEKQAAAIETEEKRHAAEMEKINQEYDKQIEAKTAMIEEKFKRKAASEVRVEYNRQTTELKQIFDQRMVELKKLQSDLSSKLMKNIKSTFSSLDLEIEDQPQEPTQEIPPVLAELKTIRAGE